MHCLSYRAANNRGALPRETGENDFLPKGAEAGGADFARGGCRPDAGRPGLWARLLLCLLAFLLSWPAAQSFAARTAGSAIPVPGGLAAAISENSPPETILTAFLGIPYRFDGAVDEFGRYSTFADPALVYPTPGLNCSGLVLAASRFLLKKNITLAQAKRDRLGDSGPDSPHGEDWDFGWDLILNISEGFSRSLLLPGGKSQDPATATGFAPRGYDIQQPSTWRELPARLQPGYLYLVSLNVEGRRKGYGLQHYHVGLIHVDSAGRAWFYQTTGKGAVSNRRDLKSPAGQESFKKAFANSGNKRKMMLVLAVALP